MCISRIRVVDRVGVKGQVEGFIREGKERG